MGETRTDQQTTTDRPGALGWTTRGDLAALTRPGAGAPVVVVHGVMADAEAWRPVAEAIAPERPVLVPNRRGRRPGPGTGVGYGLDREVADLTAWLHGLGEPADVVAHSYGGLVALEAVRRGAPARSLVLYEPVARPCGDHLLPRLRAALAAEDLDTAVEMINVDLSGYSREHVAQLRRTPAWPRLRELAVPSAEELGAIERFPLDPAGYRSLGVPVALLAGELSRHRPPYGGALERVRATLGVDDVALLPGQDHLAHVTAPDLLARTLAREIARMAVEHSA